ncbi:hypothetical protein DFP82_10590 [Psychrobacter fozii]|uniref:Uncharacterized protein n=1 Tax=Psychrobacter fozii TaxID=198480 RepID=A0A2V4UQX0_9GAMM|nr:hypothetical protein DFP82_10590 [Psychrobacter fozii]
MGWHWSYGDTLMLLDTKSHTEYSIYRIIIGLILLFCSNLTIWSTSLSGYFIQVVYIS